MSTNKQVSKGMVIECLPNLTYKIEIEDKKEVRAYLCGKMKLHRIRLLVGDKVEFVIDQNGPNNRITKRL